MKLKSVIRLAQAFLGQLLGGGPRNAACLRRLVICMAPVALWAQTCTVTNTASCPSSGAPTAGDQFSDTLNWTSSPSGVFAAPDGGENFQEFLAGEQTAFSNIAAAFSSHPANNILYSVEFTPLSQSFFSADPASCPGAGAPTCLYNNVAYAEAFADSIFKPLNQGGIGVVAADFNIDPGPYFMASQYASYCHAYSSSTVTAGTACSSPSYLYQSSLADALGTYTTVLNYIAKTYPQVSIHFSPTPSGDIFNTCGLTTVASRTEAAMEACMVPLYQAVVANVPTARFTALHEAGGVWGLFCGACPFLSDPANVDLFLQHASAAIKIVSPSTSVGAGGAFSEMGLVNGAYTCPNAGGSLNYWCDYTTLDPFLDYVGMDVYPSSTGSSSVYADLIGSPSPQPSTYGYMASRAKAAPYDLPVWVNESSAMRWNKSGTQAGGGEANTYVGSGWIGWAATNAWTNWLDTAPTSWAQYMEVQGWGYFDTPDLLCLSTDPNNTHADSPATDSFMPSCMASLPAVSTLGTAYGKVAQDAAPPFTIRLSTVGQIAPFAAQSILAAYGSNLATGTATASTIPLPVSLNGNSVLVTDATGAARSAPLFYASPSQINFEVPDGTAAGTATVKIQNQNGTSQLATMLVGAVSPGLYVLNGAGLVAASVLPVLSGTQQPLQPVYQVISGSLVGLPIDVAAPNEQFYLEMYGTGLRNAANVTVTVGGLSVPVLYAGAAPGYAGEDQVNIGPLPAALAGDGNVSVVLTANGKTANPATVTIQ